MIEKDGVKFSQLKRLNKELHIDIYDTNKGIGKKILASGNGRCNINNTEITIENTVFCQFTNQIKTTALKGSKIKIKGRFIGYDDLLEQVKIDQSILITNK